MLTENDIRLLIGPVVRRVENHLGLIILVDLKALGECVIKANETLGQLKTAGVSDPNIFKRAGHFAYWIRKLKPFSLYKPDEMHRLFSDLGKGDEEIKAFLPKANFGSFASSSASWLFINELIAVFLACGMVEKLLTPPIKLQLSPSLICDWVVGLRYDAYSPNSLAILCESLAQGSGV